jgi:hypothetical protein
LKNEKGKHGVILARRRREKPVARSQKPEEEWLPSGSWLLASDFYGNYLMSPTDRIYGRFSCVSTTLL